MRILGNRFLHRAVLLFTFAAFVVQTIRFHLRPGLPKPWGFGDFDVFHLAGGMALAGDYALAYATRGFAPVQTAFSGAEIFLPWTYPPQFGLLVAPLAALDVTLAYALFVAATAAFYLWTLRRLAGAQYRIALAVIFPALVMTTLCGQNGFLTAGLAGLCAHLMLRGAPVAGAPLGLMVIKPHLAVTLGLYSLLTRQWRVVAWAALVIAASGVAATAAFGLDVWSAFFGGVKEAGVYLEQAAYPMHRMVSVYAMLRSAGVGPGAAYAAQIVAALAAMGLVAMMALNGTPRRQALGFSLLLGLFVSPYAYDYDLPIAGVALALLLPEIARRATLADEALLLALAWAAAFWGFGLQRYKQYMGLDNASGMSMGVSLGALFLLLLTAHVWRIVHRTPAGERAGASSSSITAAA